MIFSWRTWTIQVDQKNRELLYTAYPESCNVIWFFFHLWLHRQRWKWVPAYLYVVHGWNDWWDAGRLLQPPAGPEANLPLTWADPPEPRRSASSSVCVVQGRGGRPACRSYISIRRAFVGNTSGLINSRGLTGESSQVGVTSEINLHRKCWVIVWDRRWQSSRRLIMELRLEAQKVLLRGWIFHQKPGLRVSWAHGFMFNKFKCTVITCPAWHYYEMNFSAPLILFRCIPCSLSVCQ